MKWSIHMMESRTERKDVSISGKLIQNRACKVAAHIFISIMIGIWICCGAGIGNAISAETKAALSKKEKKQLVEKGVAAFEKGRRDEAKRLLEQAGTAFAENYAVPYYLGAIYLEEGKKDAAISQWQRYVAMDANGENAMIIRKYVTLLRREQAKEKVRSAVTKGATPAGGGAPDHTIAVPPFQNMGYEVFGPLGKGLAGLLIADLSHVPNLEVVDRIQVEMMIKAEGIDGASAAKVGGLLMARHVITGRLHNVASEKLQIASTIFDTSHDNSDSNLKLEGELSQFHQLEKDLACGIVKKLGKKCKKMPEGFHQVHTRSLAALVAYSWGLEYFDEEDYDQAREMFQKALEEDPEFELAAKAMITTPTPAMRAMTTSQLIASVADNGISSSAAGNALIGGKGISNTKTIIGGAALVGGGAALAGGGGGGGTSPPPTPLPISGVWYGTTGDGSEFTLRLSQDGSEVDGTMEGDGWECMATGNVSGNTDGDDFSLRVAAPGSENIIRLEGAKSSKNRISGSWELDKVVEPCTKRQGDFTGEKATEAEIDW